ncbi:MAG: FG-GAP repeat protein [Pseudomarimonas sp.]
MVSAGDVNNDGVDDLLIGAQGDRPCGGGFCGSAWVVTGRRGSDAFPPLTQISEVVLEGGRGFRVGPTQPSGEQFGAAAASLPDFTGDGKPEWLIGAYTSRFDEGVRGKACLYLSGNGVVIAQPPPLSIDTGDLQLWLLLVSAILLPGALVLKLRR